MNQKHRAGGTKSPAYRTGRPIHNINNDTNNELLNTANLHSVKEETKADLADELPEAPDREDPLETETYKKEVERFIEISKYFSSPLNKTASYLSEHVLTSFPKSHTIEYKRGGVTTEHIKFSNLILEPIYVKLFKLTPDLEQIKFLNLSLSRCKRIPPGLSFNLGFIYDDVNEKEACNSTMIFVASRKTTTPCYQICEIHLNIVSTN